MKNIRNRITAAMTCAVLTVALALPAKAAEAPPHISSYKGNTLEVGERSGLIIGPSGAEYTVTSSDPDTVAVEQITGFWVAVAKSEGTAEIAAANSAGAVGTLTFTVGSDAPASGDSPSLTDNMDIRQELIRLINQTRKANGVDELPVSDALMNAAQAISDKRYTWHHTQEECEAVMESGYPYGFGVNLTVFTGVAAEDAAQHALDNWLNSPGHFETMIKPDCDSIGVGVTESGGATYCYLFVGRPNTHNPYE